MFHVRRREPRSSVPKRSSLARDELTCVGVIKVTGLFLRSLGFTSYLLLELDDSFSLHIQILMNATRNFLQKDSRNPESPTSVSSREHCSTSLPGGPTSLIGMELC